MPVKMTGPDGRSYNFPDGISNDDAIAYFRDKGIVAPDPHSDLPLRTDSTVGARPTGLLQTPMNWLEDLQTDVKTGSDLTLPGKALKFMGARGTDKGVPEAVGDIMPGGGTIQGAAKILHGYGTVAQNHPIRGANEILGGFGQAASPVMAVANPGLLAEGLPYAAAGAGVEGSAKVVGVDPETSEFLGNVVTGLLGGRKAEVPSQKKTVGKLAFASGKDTTAPIEAVLGDLKATVAKAGAPKSVGDFLKTVDDTKTGLNQEYANALGPHAHQKTMPKSISDRIRALETPNMQQTAQGRLEAKRIRGAAVEFEKPWTLGQLDAERMDANSRLNAYEKKSIADQYSNLKTNRNAAIDKAIADGVRETVYAEMDRLSGKPSGYFRSVKDRIGNLMRLQSSLDEKVTDLHDVSARTAGAPAWSRARVGTTVSSSATPRSWVSNLGALIHTPNPEGQASSAVRGAFRTPQLSPLVAGMPLKALLSGDFSKKKTPGQFEVYPLK